MSMYDPTNVDMRQAKSLDAAFAKIRALEAEIRQVGAKVVPSVIDLPADYLEKHDTLDYSEWFPDGTGSAVFILHSTDSLSEGIQENGIAGFVAGDMTNLSSPGVFPDASEMEGPGVDLFLRITLLGEYIVAERLAYTYL